ncbi:hypothetical protein ACU8M5_10705 [Rhizobium leguminosarum]
MSDILLYLWSDKRSYVLEELDFYLAQADRRVLVQFDNLEEEAEEFARAEFDRMGQFAGPDADPGDYADAAWDKGINHYQMLSDLQSQLTLSVAAGLYHQWEKQLREWLVHELDRSFSRKQLGPAIWKQKIDDLLALLAGLGWDCSAQPFLSVINECRLVVNVHKHGRGGSFDELKESFPQHLRKAAAGVAANAPGYRDHTDLEIGRDDLGRFQRALKDFWNAVPEHIHWSDAAMVPKWFERALTA